MNKEVRFCSIRQEQEESRTIEGYAIRFNEDSQILHESGRRFIERILPTAISDELINNSDVYALLNHNEERGMLARSKNGSGSLRLQVDEFGVKFTFDAPHTALGDEVLEGIRRKDIDACSFAFYTDDDEFDTSGEIPIRTIRTIKGLFDISVVYCPAYPTTSVDVRSLMREGDDVNASIKNNNIDDKYYTEMLKKLY